MDRRQCALFPARTSPTHPPSLPPSLPSMAGGTASNNVEARLDCSDWGHWLWWFDLLISPPPSLKCGVWDAEANLRQLWTILCLAREWEATRNLRKETTLILITRCSLQNPPPPLLLLRSRPSAHMCVPAPLFCARPCVQSRACVCVFFFFLHRCAYAVGVVRQYSHQAEQSGSINWWNSKPPASITIITNSSTQNVWLFLDKDSVLSAAILLMLSHFQTSAYDCN